MTAIGIIITFVCHFPAIQSQIRNIQQKLITIAMIVMMTKSLFSAASITIADNKMYQATTFSIVLFGCTIFLPHIFLIIIVIRITGVQNKFKKCTSKVFNIDQDSDDHTILIAATRELQ